MNGYDIPDDGKLHVNYSSLKRCTTVKGVLAVLEEIQGKRRPFDGETVKIGKIRHAQWEAEANETGYTPVDFKRLYDQRVDFIEKAFAVEVFAGVVLHFRPDAVSLEDRAVIDYKKIVDTAPKFLNDWQLKVYIYGLQLLGHPVNKSIHLCEVWDRDPTNPSIIDYQRLERHVPLDEMALVKQWVRVRANNLAKATQALTK